MAAAQSSTYKLLRDLWPQKAIYDELYKASPTLGMLKKDTSFYESHRFIDVGYGAPQGVGPDFGIAKAAKTASKTAEFSITPVSYYGMFSLSGRLMRQSKGDKAVIVKPLARESRNVITQWKRDMSRYIFGNGGGALARMTSGSAPTTSATVTLNDTNTNRAIEQGMTLQTSATDGTSGSVKSGSVTVASVVRNLDGNSTVTVDQATWAAGISGPAASDYIFRAGAFGGVLTGFEGWNPASDPTSTSFFGVDRTPDVQRLGGLRIACAGKTPREAALRSARMVADVGGTPDTYILSTTDWESLQLELQSAGTLKYAQVPSSPIGKFNFGLKYDAIQLMGPVGPISVVSDADATVGVGRMLSLDTWTLASTGELVSIIEGGAGPGGMMMEESSDAFESRLVGDFQLYCEAPGLNGRVALT